MVVTYLLLLCYIFKTKILFSRITNYYSFSTFASRTRCLLKSMPRLRFITNISNSSIPMIQREKVVDQMKQASLKAVIKLEELKMNDPAKKLWTSLGDLYDPRNLGEPPAFHPVCEGYRLCHVKSGHNELHRIVKEELAKPGCHHLDADVDPMM